jgi:excisionase family DNA binding protein
MDDSFVTVAEIAEWLKVNQQTVRNWIDRGELRAVRVGARRVRVRRADLDAFLDDGPQRAGAATLDPTDPGAMALVSLDLTKAQASELSPRVDRYIAEHGRLDSVRLEALRDAWLRIVFIGPDGQPAEEQLIPPV